MGRRILTDNVKKDYVYFSFSFIYLLIFFLFLYSTYFPLFLAHFPISNAQNGGKGQCPQPKVVSWPLCLYGHISATTSDNNNLGWDIPIKFAIHYSHHTSRRTTEHEQPPSSVDRNIARIPALPNTLSAVSQSFVKSHLKIEQCSRGICGVYLPFVGKKAKSRSTVSHRVARRTKLISSLAVLVISVTNKRKSHIPSRFFTVQL